MFEFTVGVKEIHKIKISLEDSFLVYIDDIPYRSFFNTGPIAFEVGDNEKHFVYIQIHINKKVFWNRFWAKWGTSMFNFDVFIDNRLTGTFTLNNSSK